MLIMPSNTNKGIFLLITLLSLFKFSVAQNTFPASGNVGIGTLNPGAVFGELFSINGSANLLAGNMLFFSNPGNTNAGGIKATSTSAGTAADLNLFGGAGIGTGLFIQNGGNVGIGTLNPKEQLDVNGSVLWNGFNSGNSRALKIGYSGGNYGGIGYNIDFTGSTGVFNRPLIDYSSYMELFLGGFRFFGTNNFEAANGINLDGTGQNLKLLATLTKDGHMGIGTSTPLQKFVVSNNGNEGFEVYLNQPGGVVGLQSFNRSSSTYTKMNFDASSFSFGIGDVGIGTIETRGYKLAVNGKIRAKEIKVEALPWPDYVFSKPYLLPTLQETETYIKNKGHLPGIPSAEEVKANGIDLGEMNAKLLQKIEELTLHLIEQNKIIKTMQQQIQGITKVKGLK